MQWYDFHSKRICASASNRMGKVRCSCSEYNIVLLTNFGVLLMPAIFAYCQRLFFSTQRPNENAHMKLLQSRDFHNLATQRRQCFIWCNIAHTKYRIESILNICEMHVCRDLINSRICSLHKYWCSLGCFTWDCMVAKKLYLKRFNFLSFSSHCLSVLYFGICLITLVFLNNNHPT